MSVSVEMNHYVYCDICKYETHKPYVIAYYDAKTTHGPWAYMCKQHFVTHSLGELGTGYGQQITYAKGAIHVH